MSTQSDLNGLPGKRRFIPAAVGLVIGLALSLTAFAMVRSLEDSKVRSDFEQRASRMAAALKRSVDVTLDDVNSVADFLRVARRVDAEQFRSFALPMLQRHPALQSLIWAQRVPESTRASYEAEVRTTRAPGFQIFGVLEVEGRPGAGALFRILWPQGTEAARPTQDEAKPLRRGHGERVLVVDDEPEVANLLAEMLSGAGYHVETANNGRIAVGKLAETPYDVVVTDLKMPVLDGPGFYREVGARDPKVLRRFAFITGDTLGTTSAKFLEETAAPCLVKPFRAEEVEAVVARILESATV